MLVRFLVAAKIECFIAVDFFVFKKQIGGHKIEG